MRALSTEPYSPEEVEEVRRGLLRRQTARQYRGTIVRLLETVARLNRETMTAKDGLDWLQKCYDANLAVHHDTCAALAADVERLRKRTHEIADDSNRRVAAAQKKVRDQLTPELIGARLDKENREEVHAFLRSIGHDPGLEEAGGLIRYPISHRTTVVVHELLQTVAALRAEVDDQAARAESAEAKLREEM